MLQARTSRQILVTLVRFVGLQRLVKMATLFLVPQSKVMFPLFNLLVIYRAVGSVPPTETLLPRDSTLITQQRHYPAKLPEPIIVRHLIRKLG
ncbi:hypothetical protein [Nostoc sp.]|uniref:hypothetical protein n=1 Tax=Nostoc sp. TaxID=1180 RepID=UPI002FF7E943